VDALAKVPFIAVLATHEGPELDRVHAVLPRALWAEVEGTFTNYARRVQRIRKAVAAPGEARPAWELAASLLQRVGGGQSAQSARELFAKLAATVPGYAGLDYKLIGSGGRALATAEGAAVEARV
jgi:predicted molibdopterin-dependent oxidoreductase YjgC